MCFLTSDLTRTQHKHAARFIQPTVGTHARHRNTHGHRKLLRGPASSDQVGTLGKASQCLGGKWEVGGRVCVRVGVPFTVRNVPQLANKLDNVPVNP